MPATYLVVISRSSAEERYKFDFVRKVEGSTAADKEDSFVFSVSPHETCSLTNTGREQENDAFYQRGKVIIKGESMTDIDSALSVLQIGGTSNNLTISNTGVLSSYSPSGSGSSNLNWEIGKNQAEFPALKIGSPNYKLVFLEDVDLVTTRLSPHDNLPGANLY